MQIFLSQVSLEEYEEYKSYLRTTPECFNNLFVLAKVNITNQKHEKCKDTKTKACCKIFRVHLFVVLFSEVFLVAI